MNCYFQKEALMSKDIEQVWHHRFLHRIHSGVRVKIQRKNSLFKQIHHDSKSSSFNQINPIKRLWFDSETSTLCQNDEKLLETTDNSSISYQTKPIFNNSFLRKNYLLKNMKSIGIQTIMIKQINRQTSCNLIKSTPVIIQKRRSTSSSSTSASDENSTQTDSTSTVSSTTTDTKENNDHSVRYRRNKNRNNNTIDTDIERKNNHINMKEFKIEKSNTHLSVIIH